MDPAEFLTAQYDEEEAADRYFNGHRWDVVPHPVELDEYCLRGSGSNEQLMVKLPGPMRDMLEHFARYDPARVRAELAAKRKRLALYLEAKQILEDVLKGTRPAALAEETPADFHTHVRERRKVQQAAGRFVAFEIAVRLDAMVYAEHPDFDPAWRINA